MNLTELPKQPARTISQLEREHKPRGWRFGLGPFLVITNLTGLAIAAIVITNGQAFIWLILAVYLLPLLVLLIATSVHWYERLTGKRLGLIIRRHRKPKSPFED